MVEGNHDKNQTGMEDGDDGRMRGSSWKRDEEMEEGECRHEEERNVQIKGIKTSP